MIKAIAKRLPALCLISLTGCASTETVDRLYQSQWALSSTPLDRGAGEFDNDMHEHLAWAKSYRARVLAADGPRTIENTLVPYNEMMMHLDAARAECELFSRVHPDEQVRSVAEAGEQAVAKHITELSLDHELYEAFEALDVSGADTETQYLLYKILRDFRRAGVDKSEDAREQIKLLKDEIVKLGQEFGRNTRDDEREIVLDSPADLDGLPRDWADKHQPGDDGKIHITTRYPDYIPFMTYARHAGARADLYRQFKNRGHPKNIDVLDRLLGKRY